MIDGNDVHETAVRVLKEECEGNAPMLERMREHIAYVDKLKVDRLYLARTIPQYHETVLRNRVYYQKQIADLEKQVATLKKQLAGAEFGKDTETISVIPTIDGTK